MVEDESLTLARVGSALRDIRQQTGYGVVVVEVRPHKIGVKHTISWETRVDETLIPQAKRLLTESL
jgi:hypothetical protein